MSEVLLEVSGMTVSVRGEDREKRREILSDVSFELTRGEVLALIGPNGSGKSTLMRAAAGLMATDRGEVRFEGQDFFSLSSATRALKIAYVGSDLRAEFPITAQEAVMLGRSAHGHGLLQIATAQDRERVREAMEECFCWGLRERDLQTLSGGERQLVALARALAQEASVLFLDESLSKMDLNHQAMVGALLARRARQGLGILLVSHDLNLASEWSSHALILQKGRKIAQGPILDTLTEERVQALYPGTKLVVRPSPVSGAPKVFFSG